MLFRSLRYDLQQVAIEITDNTIQNVVHTRPLKFYEDNEAGFVFLLNSFTFFSMLSSSLVKSNFRSAFEISAAFLILALSSRVQNLAIPFQD